MAGASDPQRSSEPAPEGLVNRGQQGSAQVPGAPSDNTTLVAVLAEARSEGFTADFVPEATADVRCGACGVASPAASFRELVERRLEGASDPADMLLVVAGRCPACDATGVMILTYGPAASEVDTAVLAQLP